MKPIDGKSDSMLNKMKILMKKILNIKLVIVSKYQNKIIFLLKDIFKTGQKKFSG